MILARQGSLGPAALLSPVIVSRIDHLSRGIALPPYELERMADGQFSVTINGVRRSGTLDAGAGFGEIALLPSVPRTCGATMQDPTARRSDVDPRPRIRPLHSRAGAVRC